MTYLRKKNFNFEGDRKKNFVEIYKQVWRHIIIKNVMWCPTVSCLTVRFDEMWWVAKRCDAITCHACRIMWCGVVWCDALSSDYYLHISWALTACVTCTYVHPFLLGHVQVRRVRGGSLRGVQVWVHDAAGQRHHKGQSHLPPHSLVRSFEFAVSQDRASLLHSTMNRTEERAEKKKKLWEAVRSIGRRLESNLTVDRSHVKEISRIIMWGMASQVFFIYAPLLLLFLFLLPLYLTSPSFLSLSLFSLPLSSSSFVSLFRVGR